MNTNFLDELNKFIIEITNIDPNKDQQYTNDDNGLSYSVYELIKLAKDIPVVDVELDDLDDQITTHKMWCKGRSDKHDVLIGISDVIDDPKLYDDHYQDMVNSDLTYPILIAPNGEVMDGNHRLGNAVILNNKTIPTKTFDDWDMLKPAIIDDGDE